MSRSFFLSTLLPPLHVGEQPKIALNDLISLYRENLSSRQWKHVQTLVSYVDLKRIQATYLEQFRSNPLASFNLKELQEGVLLERELPQFVLDMLQDLPNERNRLDHFSKVWSFYFREMEDRCRGFLKEYFRFERKWRIVLAAYRSKQLGFDLVAQLQHEDRFDPLVLAMLAQNESPSVQFPFEFADLGERLQAAQHNPNEQYRLIAEFQFAFIEKNMENARFSLDYFLGYLLQLMIVEDGTVLDANRGSLYLNEMIKDVL